MTRAGQPWRWLLLGSMCVSGCAGWKPPSPPVPNIAPRRQARLMEVAESFERQRDRVQFEVALSHWRHGEAARCRELLETILQRNADHIEARLLLAEVCLARQQTTEALSQLREAVDRFPNDARAQHLLGLVLEDIGHIAEALECFEQAARVEPHNEVYQASYQQATANVEGVLHDAASPVADTPQAPYQPAAKQTDKPNEELRVRQASHEVEQPPALILKVKPHEPPAEAAPPGSESVPTTESTEAPRRQQPEVRWRLSGSLPHVSRFDQNAADSRAVGSNELDRPTAEAETATPRPTDVPTLVQIRAAHESSSRAMPPGEAVWTTDAAPTGPTDSSRQTNATTSQATSSWRSPPRELPIDEQVPAQELPAADSVTVRHIATAPLANPINADQRIAGAGLVVEPVHDAGEVLQRARESWNRQDISATRQLLNALLREDALHVEGHLLMAETYLAEGFVDRAIDRMERMVAQQPDNPMAHYALGLILEAAGRHDEAEACFAQATDPPFLADGSTEWAGQQMPPDADDQGTGDGMEPVIAPVLIAPAPNMTSLLEAGRQALAEGRVDDALASYRRAVELAHHDPSVTVRAAVEALKQEQPSIAVELTQSALLLHPESAVLHRTLGAARFRSGDWKGARTSLERAIGLDNAHALSYFLLGCALRELGDNVKAQANFQRAAELDSRFAEVR